MTVTALEDMEKPVMYKKATMIRIIFRIWLVLSVLICVTYLFKQENEAVLKFIVRHQNVVSLSHLQANFAELVSYFLRDP